MIQIYAKGTTDFTRNGIRIQPQESTVTFTDNGQFDFEMVVPADSEYTSFDYGQVIEASVPEQEIGDITLGSVSYYTVSNGEGTKLYAKIPNRQYFSYSEWNGGSQASGSMPPYSVGSYVTYLGQNYVCNTWDESSQQCFVPPNNNSWWTQTYNYYDDPGETVETLSYGDDVMKTSDFNSDYMEIATLSGKTGYVKKSDCTATGQSGNRVLSGRTITTQRFLVTEVKKEQQGRVIRVTAEHVSYQLGRTILGDCAVTNVSPATALLFIAGAMREEYGGGLYTNMTQPMITADWSWKNAQNAVMDPKAGLLAVSGARMIRDNLDIIILAESAETAKYSVRYGSNLKDVKWTGDVSSIVTRIYPTAQTEDGRTLLLPEEHIDSVRTVPFIQPEVLNTGLKVGQKIKNSDGTETELTQDEIYTRMRAAANNRFSIDKCDQAEISLEVDWQHMPDTVEYEEYAALKNAAPGDIVEVVSGPLGISEHIRMTGYTWDPINEIYKSAKFGDIKARPTVAGYNLKSGSVGSFALAYNAVSGANIQQGSITAREIEANSITAEKIASRQIITELLAANAVTANEINASAVTAEKIAAGSITTVKLAAEAVTAEKIDAGAVTADKIGAGAVTTAKLDSGAVTTVKLDAYAVTADKLAAEAVTAEKIDANSVSAINAKLGTAEIAIAAIQNADINYARVKDLQADEAIFGTTITEQGIADRLYINRLLITYGQMVEATIGDLIIGDSNGDYFHIDVEWDEDGVPTLVPTQVTTPSAAEIAAGHTSDGQTIIGNVGTFAELSSEDFYAINSIIDRITAKRIDVDQLWARQAFINKLMVTDISSNTYIQSTIGNWTSGSTITQSIASLDSRISSLGYGTVYMQPEEPSHAELVAGDIWIQTQPSGTWSEVYSDYATWQTIYNDVSTWQTLGGVSIMWVWDGRKWQQQLNNLDSDTFETEIEQNAQNIQLLANRTTTLEGNVTTLSASLQVANDAITAEVSRATNAENGKIAKTTSYQTADSIYTAAVSAAVSQAGTAAASAYIAKTTTYQDANSIVLTAEQYAANAADTAESNAKSYTSNNFYALKSGIDIKAAGIEISGGKYVKILAGSTVKMLLDQNGIDMQTAGKFYLHAQDSSNSAILFGTNKSSATFSVGESGDVVAHSLVVGDLTVNGNGFPRIVIAETQPSSGSNVLWIKPSSASEKTWNFRPSSLVLDNAGGTLGYFKDFTCPYAAADYLSGSLYYGIKARLQFYNMSGYENHTFKARLKNGNSWIDIGSVTQTVGQWGTLVLDVMMGSATTNVMNVSGGNFTIRLESTASSAKAMLLNEDIIFRAKNTSSGSFASCSVFYKQ